MDFEADRLKAAERYKLKTFWCKEVYDECRCDNSDSHFDELIKILKEELGEGD